MNRRRKPKTRKIIARFALLALICCAIYLLQSTQLDCTTHPTYCTE